VALPAHLLALYRRAGGYNRAGPGRTGSVNFESHLGLDADGPKPSMKSRVQSPPAFWRVSVALTIVNVSGLLIAIELLARSVFQDHFLLTSFVARAEIAGLALLAIVGLSAGSFIAYACTRALLRHPVSAVIGLWAGLFASDYVARDLVDSPFRLQSVLLLAVVWLSAAVFAVLAEKLQSRVQPGRPSAWHSLCWVLLLVASVILPSGNEEPTDEASSGLVGAPDIILVSIDTARADLLEGADPVMPALRELANSGVQFSRAFSPSNWTLPSHASIFTSLQPPVHGAETIYDGLADETRTFVQVFEAAGYRSLGLVDGDRRGFVGADRGFSRGFDHYVHFPASRGIGEQLLPFRLISDVLSFGDRGHAEDIVSAGVDWLELETDAPSLLFVHLYDLHPSWGASWPLHRWPYMPRQPYLQDVGVDVLPRDHFQFDGMSGARYLGRANGRLAAGDAPASVVSDADLRHLIDYYNSSAHYVDQQLSVLWRCLAQRSRPYVLCVTADHGEEFLEHGRLGHQQKHTECLRVPMVWVGPGVVPNLGIRDQIVQSIDIAPTFLQLAGLAGEVQYQGEGLFSSSPDSVAEAFAGNEDERIYALRTEEVTYIVHQELGREQIFDPRIDPDEQRDLRLEVSSVSSTRLRSLRARIAAWRAENIARRETPAKIELDDATIELLRSLGYIQ